MIRSPIKYFGGKSHMVDCIINQFPKEFNVYAEPFVGGGSVLFNKAQSGVEIINDISNNVYSVFKCLSDHELFLKVKEKLDVTYYSRLLRENFKDDLLMDLDIAERAYKFIYVTRTSFNGVGGFSVNKLVRRNMCKSVSDYLSMVDGLFDIHNRLSSVVVENLDIFDFIDKYDSDDVFMYLDPPYVIGTRKSNQKYQHEFTDKQHEMLCDRILNCKSKILLSGYDNEIYDMLDVKYKKVYFNPKNSNSKVVEVLWKNYD